MDIAAEVRRLRLAHVQTLAEVAAGTGLSISYLSDIERGRTIPSIDTLQKIAEWYGLRLHISFEEAVHHV